MDKYTRYFRITSGPVIEAVTECRAINAEAHKQYGEILTELGAEPGYYQREGKLVAIQFEERPDGDKYKRMDCGGWYPKRNTKEGRALHKRIDSIVTKPVSSALSEVGLRDNPTIFDSRGGRCYYPTILVKPSDSLVVFISVPWFDCDPDKLVEYVKDREAGTRGDGNYDALLWEPTYDMTEVKNWEVEKEIDQWNESVNNG